MSTLRAAMHWYIALVFLLCSSCTSNHGRPIAKLDFESVAMTPSASSFFVRFSSDTDLLTLFQSRIGQELVCALDGDADFSIGHYQKRYGSGIVELSGNASKGNYISRVIFRETGAVRGKQRILAGDELRRALRVNDVVVCVFRVHTTKYKTYFSDFMRIPAMDFIRALGT